MKTWGSEAELAAAVVAHLQDLQWDIFQEVEGFSGRADIVGVQKPRLIVVETKNALSFDVIAQAQRWKPYAHQVYIAVPKTKGFSDGRRLAYDVCKIKGIGVFECSKGYSDVPMVEEKAPAQINRTILPQGLRNNLLPEHKVYAKAGSAKGDYFTPFKGTCASIALAVREKPGSTLKEVIDAIQHHYATPHSARSSLSHWIEKGKVPGVRLEKKGGKLCLFPVEIKESAKLRTQRQIREKVWKASNE